MKKFYGFEGDFRVRTSEINTFKELKLVQLMQLMQEASMQNVLQLKLSVWDLEEESLTWILLKKDIHIYSMPTVGENIKIRTYPSGFKKIFAYRDFKVFNEQGSLLATSSSTWGLMDMSKRRLVTIPSYEFYDVIPDGSLDPPSFNIKELNEYSELHKTKMRWHDLDWNGHINNSVLVKQMLESLPSTVFESKQLTNLKLQFKSESFLHDELSSKSNFDGTTSDHSLYRDSDKKLIAIAQMTWKERTKDN